MCGIFGGIINPVNTKKTQESFKGDLVVLASAAERRGSDSFGLFYNQTQQYHCETSVLSCKSLLNNINFQEVNVVVGHSRLVTNGCRYHQPVTTLNSAVAHNGIIINYDDIFEKFRWHPSYDIDSEAILAIYSNLKDDYLPSNSDGLFQHLFKLINGTASLSLVDIEKGLLFLATNNRNIFTGCNDSGFYFASERSHLKRIDCRDIALVSEPILKDVIPSSLPILRRDSADPLYKAVTSLISLSSATAGEEKLLKYRPNTLRRCTRCILPSSMPFIQFDDNGVCNYCLSYKKRQITGSLSDLSKIVDRYQPSPEKPCIIPFSGGRDSTYALHVISKELGLPCITYTYDWGMVTDLARRNISRICSALSVENIIISPNIRLKRKYVRDNLIAWLKRPHLGMISLLTAGDKYFFKWVETIKSENNLDLSLWGVNPYEITHFKSGFLGMKPNFMAANAYSHSSVQQLKYQLRRAWQYALNPLYLNSSLLDTLGGEYWRSVFPKKDVYHLFDYMKWNEVECEAILDSYEWERAPDTGASWRIGDGTAAFYNYVYYTVAGFTEHDTFRSNQVREGDITREAALSLVEEENKPRYPNIKWYTDILGLDFVDVVSTVNAIKPLY
jgi:glucosamine--fructose-6-phosphate aminotransferase (isomerizing)